MLKLLLDAQEASIDLLCEVLDRLVRVDAQQAGLLFMLSLHHNEILIAERVAPQFELEERLVLVVVVDLLDELLSALWRSQISLRTWRSNVGEAIKGELGHHLILTLGLDTHLRVIETLNHGYSQVEHDVSEEHRCDNEGRPEQELVTLAEPRCVRFSNRNVEHKQDLL